jgi:glycine C-acetyltransferase/8-amino-7-oxononanoate synthase
MLDLDDRLDELRELGLYRRTRMVSGPQGPRVVLDGRPALLLCSGNALGLADHPRVREAAAEAAMRWGVGAAAPRLSCGTMTLHRRLEERLAGFIGARSAVLFGSGTLANLGVIPALARRGEVVLYDERSHPSIADGCRLAGAEAVPYEHGDPESLLWSLRQCDGRAALIATDSVFGTDGDVAPLDEIVELARRFDVRLLVDEAHGLGSLGPGGRGAVADAGLEGEVDVITGSLGKGLGSYGGFACCDPVTASYLVNAAGPLLHSTAPAPVAVAAALAALELLDEQPRRVEKLQANAALLRDELAREGFDVAGTCTHVVPVLVGRPEVALRIVDAAVADGVFAEALVPPLVPDGAARLRVAAMASHSRAELREAAQVLGRAALRCGFRPGAGSPIAAAANELPRAA